MPSTARRTFRAFHFLVSLVAALLLTGALHATIDSALQTQLGNPSSATADPSNHSHYLISRPQYGLDYADTTREPNWVSWDLTSDDVGSSGRSNFIQDTTLPAGFYQVLTTDYSGSGYDRGHMCPSADRTVTVADNQQVFYMSNMVPQAPDNNQGIWANFESYCRSLASAGNEILITCGPSGFGGSTIASGVAIPGYTWKIVLVVPLGSGTAASRITTSTRVIAIKVPNVAGVRSTPWQNFVTSIAQIEADTGYTFLTNLPTATRTALRTVVDGQSTTGAPVIVSQPSAQTTVVGGSASFSVTATGDAPLAYQWYKDDDQAVVGATSATLTLNGVQASDIGSYYVVVSNAVGTATSSPAALVVMGVPPSITSSPTSQAVNAGATVTFAVAATGSPTLTYQWRKNTASISGATNSTLTLSNVQTTNAGSYDVVVTNSSGTATSDPASLTVVDVAPTIVTSPTSKAATTGSNASFSVVATGTTPLTYSWRKDGTPLSNTGAYSGTATATLVVSNVSSVNGGNYDVVVSNSLGFATSAAATLTVNPPAPSTVYWDFGTTALPIATPTSGLPSDVTGGAVSQGNNNGTTPLLTTTSGSSGYTGSSGTVNVGAAARIGALNQATNGSAYFELTLAPTSGKRLYVSGISFGMRSTSTGPQAWAVYTSVDGFAAPVATGTIGADSAWHLVNPTFAAVTGPTSTAVTFRLYGYNGAGSPGANTANWRVDDLKLLVSTLFPPPVAPVVTGSTPAAGATGVAVSTPITVSFNEAVSFTGTWFSINSASTGPVSATVTGGPTTFTLTPPSFFAYNDTVTVTIHANQVVDQASGSIPGAGDMTFSFTTESFVPPTPPTVTTQPLTQSVNVGGNATFTVAASGTAPFTYQWRKAGQAIGGNPSAGTASLTIANAALSDAGSYDCVVSNAAGSDVSHTATLSVTVVPPSITTQPAGQIAAEGGSATFSVVAAGTAPLTYQWRRNGTPLVDGASVAGSTTATVSLSGLTYLDSGTIDVVVTNSANSVTSTAATLAVSSAPSVVYWDFATANPTSGLPAGVSGGTVTQGNNNGTTALLTTTSGSGSYAGASGGNNAGAAARIGALNQASGGSAYFEFTFTPAAGSQFAATALTFGARSTGTGPQAYAVFTNADGYTVPIATGALLNDSSWRLITTSFHGVVGAAGAPVTFRLYGYAGTGSPGTGTANWRIDDVKLSAGLLAVAQPPTVTTAPTAQTATVGDSVSFQVAVSGTAPFSYVWRKNGSAISGNASAATPILTLTNITTTDAASYDCVITNVAGSATTDAVALTVNKATATVTLSDLSATYDGSVHVATATTTPAGFHVVLTYDGGSAGPVNAGSYAVVATIDDPNYAGSTLGTLTIAKAVASVSLGNLAQVYTGTARTATAATSPTGLTVNFTYDGGTMAPVNAGSYGVVGTVSDPNYVGSASGTLVIAPAPATLTFSNLNAVYDGAAHPATVTTIPAGVPVSVTYDGVATAPTNAGVYAVAASVTDPNFTGSGGSVLTITKATATITLTGLAQTFDGTPKNVSVATNPTALTFDLTYNGSTTAPTNAGSYPVVVTVHDANYAGSASGTLVIAPANATITLADLTQPYDGTPKSVTATTSPADLPVSITYNGSAVAPTNPGTYVVVATITDPNYTASATGDFYIGAAVLVRHAPVINGDVVGSIQQMLAESTTVNSSGSVSGDLLVPGLPAVVLNGHPTYGGTEDGNGANSPTNYSVILNGNSAVRHVVRRTDAIALPAVAAPPAPLGTRNVTMNSPSDSAGDFATVRNLTLNGNAGEVALPAGTYGSITVNGSSVLTLGVANATQPAVYNLQGLVLNGSAQLKIVGPVTLTLASGTALNGGTIGASAHPDWLTLQLASGDVTLNGGGSFNGAIVAPTSTVTINRAVHGTIVADRLVLNGSGSVEQP